MGQRRNRQRLGHILDVKERLAAAVSWQSLARHEDEQRAGKKPFRRPSRRRKRGEDAMGRNGADSLERVFKP